MRSAGAGRALMVVALFVVGLLALVNFAFAVVGAMIILVAFRWVGGQAPPHPALICPHCQQQGTVHTTSDTVKAGISGGKATGAVLTGGLSVVFTGLSRTRRVITASCDNCGMRWTIQ